jgi:hypothetical protein
MIQMANDVTHASKNTVGERDPYADYADEVNSRPFVGDMIRFTKHGEYKAGQDQVVVEEGTRMVCYMPSMKRGWVKWGEGMPQAHIMGLVAEGFRPPPREELGDLDENEWEELDGRPIDPWQKTNHLVMCDLDGQLYTFITASKGGLSAVGQLSEAYALRRRMKPEEIPVIELLSRSYNHKDYGETFAPVLKIVGWTKVPETFTDLNNALEDSSDETLELENLGANGESEEEIEGEIIDEETGEVIEDEPGEGEGDDVPEDEPEPEDEDEKQPAPPRRAPPREAPQPPRRAAAMPQRSAPVKPAQRSAPVKPAQRTAPTKPTPPRAPVKPAAKPSAKPATKPTGKPGQRTAAHKAGAKKRSVRL